MPSETKMTSQIVRNLRRAGAVVLNKLGTAQEGVGWPDIWIGSMHFEGWVEFKSETGKLSGSQEHVLRCMETNRVHAVMMRLPSGIACDSRGEVLGEVLGTRAISTRAVSGPDVVCWLQQLSRVSSR